jgi:hypothetical protein
MASLDTESDPQTIAAIICESMKAKDEALRCAIGHLEHMAAWLSGLNSGYSFECLGEDMPGIRAALGPSASARPIGDSTS